MGNCHSDAGASHGGGFLEVEGRSQQGTRCQGLSFRFVLHHASQEPKRRAWSKLALRGYGEAQLRRGVAQRCAEECLDL